MKNNEEAKEIKFWNNLPPTLTNDETLKLIKEYKMYGDKKIRDKIVYGNMRFVAFYISRYCNNLVNLEGSFPSMEDLFQDGAYHCVRAVEQFNLDYSFTFATFLGKVIKCALINKYVRKAKKHPANKTVSLQDKLKGSYRHQDDDGASIEDIIEDEKFTVENIHSMLEWNFIEKDILPYFSKRERAVFLDYFKNFFSQQELAKKYNVSQMTISRMIISVCEKIKEVYQNGVSEEMKVSKGLKVDKRVVENYLRCQEIIKKYGNDFLIHSFIPTLKPKTRQAFKSYLFGNYGQELPGNSNSSFYLINQALESLEKFGDELLELYKLEKRTDRKVKVKSLKTQQEFNRNERLLNQYGGKLFLAKYFLPVLTPNEQAVFTQRYLSYAGETQAVMAEKAGVLPSNFSNICNRVLKKLEQADFEVIVDMVDNGELKAPKKQPLIKNETRNITKARERFELVQKKGGIEKLRKYFVPILSDEHKEVFERLYLSSECQQVLEISKELNVNPASVYAYDKILMKKLEATNIEEFEQISIRAERAIANEEMQSHDMQSKFLSQYGGEPFLREVFMPTLQVKAHKVVFESMILRNKPIKEVLIQLNIGKDRIHYVHSTKKELLVRLKLFKEETANFEDIVKSFYMQKEFDRLHPENFEELAFEGFDAVVKENEISLSNVGRLKDFNERKEIIDKFISKFGDRKELIRRFMPTLKSATQQQVFLSFFIEYKRDVEIRREYDLTPVDVSVAKKAIIPALEKYSQERRDDKDKTKNK